MLYPTHHPYSLQFHRFITTPPPPLSPSLSHLLRLLHLSSSPEMECVENALKSSVVRPELAFKLTQQPVFIDDICMGNGQSGVSGDDFSIDDLLDFTNEGIGEGMLQEEDEEEEDKGCGEVTESDNSNLTTTFSLKDEFPSVPATELTVPADDLADLEWLSHFVEDSFSEYSVPFPNGTLTEKAQNRTENENENENAPEPTETPVEIKSCLKTPFPAKARSKRARTGGRVWSMGSPSLTESSSSSSSSTSSSLSSPWLIYPNTCQNVESFHSAVKLPAKKQKRRFDLEAGGGAQPATHRCSHCGVQKTPQWRTGPLGAKTLCNACGVRYKSGRLLPEYRPACSPTFSSEIHSNHHRKVLEMRRKKETTRPESGLAPAVPSF